MKNKQQRLTDFQWRVLKHAAEHGGVSPGSAMDRMRLATVPANLARTVRLLWQHELLDAKPWSSVQARALGEREYEVTPAGRALLDARAERSGS